MDKSRLFGFEFSKFKTIDAVVTAILEDAENNFTNKFKTLITPNAHTSMLYNQKEYKVFFEFYKNSAYILPDGMPIVKMSQLLQGENALQNRITGSDVFPEIWEALKNKDYPIVMVLPNENLAAVFSKENPNTTCLIPKIFDPNDEDYILEFAKKIAATIYEKNAKFLFLGLVFPKQEKLGKSVIEALSAINKDYGLLNLLLGASYEFYVGNKKRAPIWMQKAGIEWLHRFLSEPKRLWKRYTIDNFKFLSLCCQEIINFKFKKK